MYIDRGGIVSAKKDSGVNDTLKSPALFQELLILLLVMQLLEKLQDTFNSGDQEIRKWFLIRHNYLPFLLCFAYVIMSVTGPIIMKNRKPFNLRKVMIVFNFSIVIIYATSLILAAYYLPMVPWEQFCMGGAVIEGEPSYLLTRVAWFIYLLRYVEFSDTLFFILRKKEHLVSFLHVFHHSIVPILGWVVFRTEKSALQSIPALMNCFVHVIMYTYYGLAAMGPKVRKYLWWKKYLTQLQIVQFMLIILFVTVIAPMSGCTMVTLSYIMDIIFAPLFLFLFYRFYKTSFTPTVKKIH